MAAPSPNNATNASISCYFRILLASNAETMVVIEPNSMASHIVKLFISENSGKIRPIISPAKVSFGKSKKYPASLSRLFLSFSFRSLCTS